jgi:hypothetical protein
MNQLRLEADEASGKVEELQTKVKTLEQENLSKEQEITSLSHKNGILEGEVEKLEEKISELKKSADDGQQHGTQNETLTRRLQLLEEEAEQADKTLREANEKYVEIHPATGPLSLMAVSRAALTHLSTSGSDRPTSRPATLSARSRPSRPSATTGSPSTRRWPRSTMTCRRSSRSSSWILVTSDLVALRQVWTFCSRGFRHSMAGLWTCSLDIVALNAAVRVESGDMVGRSYWGPST